MRRFPLELVVAVGIAAAMIGLLHVMGDLGGLRAIETESLDMRMRLRGTIRPGPEVALVLVDDSSLARLGRWPFSRRLFARMVQCLDDAGARVVAFDLLFSEPEQPVPAELRQAARDAGPVFAGTPLASALSRLAAADPDGEMAAAMARSGKVLLPFALVFRGPAIDSAGLDRAAYATFLPSPEHPDFTLRPQSALAPVDALADAAAGLGHVTIAFDSDGAPRYEYLALPYDADFYPALSVRVAAAYLRLPWAKVAAALGSGISLGGRRVPTDPAMRMLINYRGPRGTFPTWSFADVLDGRVPADAFKDRIVLVGSAATGINDAFRSPFREAPLPGVERMANVVDNLLRGDFVTRPAVLALVEAAAVLALAGLVGAAVAWLPNAAAAGFGLALLAGWLAVAQAALVWGGVWLAVAAPLLELASALAAALVFRHTVVDRERRRVATAFGRYLAPAMVAELAAHPERLRLGGETRAMTVLFCDVRNFTRLSESLAPQALVHLLNRFFTPMTEIVLAHHGTVDKYIGDCLMAFWNAPLDDPDHAGHACAAGRAMLDAVVELNARLAAEDPGAPQLAVGIGINSGPCCVGNLGSEMRFDYSVLGDTVNIAARLEGLTKAYGVPLLAGDDTRALAPHLPWLAIDEVAVRGRAAPVRMHALWTGDDIGSLADLHDALLGALGRGDGQRAAALLAEARSLAGESLAEAHRRLGERLGASAQASGQ